MLSHSTPSRRTSLRAPVLPADRGAAPLRRSTGSSATPTAELLRAAQRAARLELQEARGCGCCAGPFEHLSACLGSTVFLDEDPRRLWAGLTPQDRSVVSLRVLAAYVVLVGRPREELFPGAQPKTWAALELLAAPLAAVSGPGSVSPEPAGSDELLRSVQELIRRARAVPELDTEPRVQQALAHLWAASDALEGARKG